VSNGKGKIKVAVLRLGVKCDKEALLFL